MPIQCMDDDCGSDDGNDGGDGDVADDDGGKDGGGSESAEILGSNPRNRPKSLALRATSGSSRSSSWE